MDDPSRCVSREFAQKISMVCAHVTLFSCDQEDLRMLQNKACHPIESTKVMFSKNIFDDHQVSWQRA